MKAKILKIEDPKISQNGDVKFYRVKMRLEDGTFAMTDIVPKFKNYAWWKNIIKHGKGYWIEGVKLRSVGKVDADSMVKICRPPLDPLAQALLF